MKKFFIDNIYNADKSVTIREFTGLSSDLLNTPLDMNSDLGFCCILDTETTGLDFGKDEIIEIAIRKWIYHKKDHYLIKPVVEYSELNEPQRNVISEAITALTGITPADVLGRKINWSIVSKLIGESDFVLAHNAGFDRPMIEAVAEVREVSAAKIWTCSFKQVNWDKMGFLSSKQELLCMFHGFHYSGHRALTDIDALAHLLMHGDYLKEILNNAKTKQICVDCIQAPFESKDILKAHGFSWNVPNKFWTKLIADNELDNMKIFLTEEVYPAGKMRAEFTPIELRDRFKA